MGFECIICKERLENPAPGVYSNQREKNSPPMTRARTKTLMMCTDTDIVSYKCGHCFHTMCIAYWFDNSKKRECPSCRRHCPTRDMRKLYPSLEDSFVEALSTTEPELHVSTSTIKVWAKEAVKKLESVGEE